MDIRIDNIMNDAKKNFNKKEHKIEIISHQAENICGNNIHNSLNNYYLFNKHTNIVSSTNNNIGYIIDDQSQIINSSKLKFDNYETEEKSNPNYSSNKTNNPNIRLDMDIHKTYVKSKTDDIKRTKMNSSIDTI